MLDIKFQKPKMDIGSLTVCAKFHLHQSFIKFRATLFEIVVPSKTADIIFDHRDLNTDKILTCLF